MLIAWSCATLSALGEQFIKGVHKDLVDLALEEALYTVVDHRCLGCHEIYEEETAPVKVELPPVTYYVAGVNPAQRLIYDEHCDERFAQRSPFHYSSVAEVEEKKALAGEIWRRRRAFEVRRSFVAFDGLVVQPPTCDCDDDGLPPSLHPGRIYLFERFPGFNGLGRLVVALNELGEPPLN